METTVLTIAGITVPLLGAMWIDMRKRTNGSGPIAKQLDRLEDHFLKHLENHSK